MAASVGADRDRMAPPRAGVIGSPIVHSLSPVLHRFWLQSLGIAGSYDAIEVRREGLAEFFDQVRGGALRGFNITLPHKVAAMALVDEVTPRASRAGAINTVLRLPTGRLRGDSTDGFGFLASLADTVPDFRVDAGPVCLLGAGGAARGIAAALLDAGAPEVRVANRSPARAMAMCDHLGGGATALPWEEAPAACRDAMLLVNATSLGMTGKDGFDPEFLDELLARLPDGTPVCDIVYVPLVTELLEKAGRRGAPVVDGLGMLLHQGRPGFQAWFGVEPQVTPALREAVLAWLARGPST